MEKTKPDDLLKEMTIRKYKVKEHFISRLIKIITPFSIYNWILILLIVTIVLVNKYMISHYLINIIMVIISLVILFA